MSGGMRFTGVLAAVAMLALLAGCGLLAEKEAGIPPPGAESTVGEAGGQYAPAPEMRAMDEMPMEGGSVSATGDTSAALSVLAAAEAAEDRKVIKTGEVSVEVDRLEDAQKTVVSTVEGRGGFVSSLTVSDYDTYRQSEIIARVPSASFREVYEAVKGLGKVTRDHIGGQDVTDQWADLERRIANQQVLEQRLRELAQRTGSVSDLLEVERELARVRGEIESYQGQLRMIKDQVAFSTLTITLTEYGPAAVQDTGGWRIVYHLKGAWYALGRGVRALVVALIYIVIAGAVVWIPLLIIILLIRGWVRRRRAARAARQAPPAPPAQE